MTVRTDTIFISITANGEKIKHGNEILTHSRSVGKTWRLLEETTVIYVTGDTHGEISRFHSPEMRKVKKGDTLIVCGDFGFIWDGGEKEEKNLKKLGAKKYNLLFLDGTHENFDLLSRYPTADWCGGKAQHICGNLYHLLRGQVYEIEGKKIFTFGGGESPEKQIRMEVKKWWASEMPGLDEMRAGIDNLKAADMKVDYIFSHEPPPRVDVIIAPGKRRENKNQLEAFFGQIAEKVGYRKWFFGSTHVDRKVTYKNISVFNLVVPVEEQPGKRRFLIK